MQDKDMSKVRKQKKRVIKTLVKKTPVIQDKLMPEGHRYDEEIYSICSTLLLRLEMARLSKPTSEEKEAKLYLRKLINKKEISPVAIRYFSGILDLAAKNPLSKIVAPMISSTHEEHKMVKIHMEQFSRITMRERFYNLIKKLKANNWAIIDDDVKKEDLDDIENNTIILHSDIEDDFCDNENVKNGFTVAGVIKNNNEFVRLSYSEGLIFFKKPYTKGYFLLHLFPDNNIPGASFMPEKEDKEDNI